MASSIYESKHTGTNIDNAVDAVEDITKTGGELDKLSNRITTNLNNINTTNGNLKIINGGDQFKTKLSIDASENITGDLKLQKNLMVVAINGNTGDGVSPAQLKIDTNKKGVVFGYGNTSAKIENGKVTGAVWNDYAEYRQSKELEPGRVIVENGDGTLKRSTERLQPGAEIISDTFGFSIGETEKCKTPVAVSGRVLAYPNENKHTFRAGDPVCSGPNGTVSKMTREEVKEWPDRMIGTVSEIPNYKVWGSNNIRVNDRIWIRIK